jgi:hypothetical protein
MKDEGGGGGGDFKTSKCQSATAVFFHKSGEGPEEAVNSVMTYRVTNIWFREKEIQNELK